MSEQELELKFRKIIEESEQNLRKEWHMQLSSQEEFNHRLDSEMNKIRTKLSRVAAQAAHDHRTIDIAAKIFDRDIYEIKQFVHMPPRGLMSEKI